MTPERLRQIRHLFEAALERDRDGRTVFLSEACQGDQRLFVGAQIAASIPMCLISDKDHAALASILGSVIRSLP